jgi:hypothetical protein
MRLSTANRIPMKLLQTMRNAIIIVVALLVGGRWGGAVRAQVFTNQGLVGVGRISANNLDAGGQDTLGGFFSGLAFDPSSWSRSGTSAIGYIYSGRFYAMPDRGPNGSTDYHPRRITLTFTFSPYSGSSPVGQTQLVMTNPSLTLLTYGGTNFTGAEADDSSVTAYPQCTTGSVGKGHRSLDAEGITLASDGTFYVCDEYGPNVYHFDATGHLLNTLLPPTAFVPKDGSSYPRANNFTEASDPDSGRYGSRGFESVALTPDSKQLVALLQSPQVQDGENKNGSINTRLLVYNVDGTSSQSNSLVGEYVYQLSLNGADAGDTARSTPVNDILAINNTQFLIIEHDTRGLGGDSGDFLYKRVNLIDISHATNILGTGYDLELGAPGQLSLPKTGNPSGVTPVTKTTLVNLLDSAQLSKFGLNTNTTSQNQNTLPESFEALALVPVGDPVATNDYFLCVGNDNNFAATKVIVNGVQVDSNSSTVDSLLLVYRVTLPGATVPQPAAPTVTTDPAGNIGSTSATFNARVNPNGFLTAVQFEYGTTTNYGTLTATQSVGSSNVLVAIATTVTSLSPNTTYHYRVDATNLVGTAQGADQSFTTLPGPPTPITTAATGLASSAAILNGTVAPNGLATMWWFELGTNSSYGFSSVTQALLSSGTVTAVSLPLAGLAPNTTYHFRLDASNSAGSVTGADVSVTTNPFIDSDGDGIPDDYELANGLDPNNPNDANADSDGDGMSNLQEYLAGTDPHNCASAFTITSITCNGADVSVAFNSIFGKMYQVQTAADLSSNSWSVVTGGDRIPGTGGSLQITDAGGGLRPGAVYRVYIIP